MPRANHNHWIEPLESRTLLSSSHLGNIHVAAAPPSPVTVMTQNLYTGAELTPLFSATSLPELAGAVSQIWATVQSTDFPARAEALANEIADAGPELVGLQEASLWQVQGTGGTVQLDYVQTLLDALSSRGLNYHVVSAVTNASATLPDAAGDLISLTDRDVIIARTDLPASQLQVFNPQDANFQTHLSLPIGTTGLTFDVLRGWASVDAEVSGKTFRFITTHLEPMSPLIPGSQLVQVLQGLELLAGPALTNLPTVIAGDFNSDAYFGHFGGPDVTITYPLFRVLGFKDAWAAANPGQVGFTWGQAEDLRNPVSTLNERIDHIFARGSIKVTSADIVGDELTDRTASGLWPSDHAGVVATLTIGNRPRPFAAFAASTAPDRFSTLFNTRTKIASRAEALLN